MERGWQPQKFALSKPSISTGKSPAGAFTAGRPKAAGLKKQWTTNANWPSCYAKRRTCTWHQPDHRSGVSPESSAVKKCQNLQMAWPPLLRGSSYMLKPKGRPLTKANPSANSARSAEFLSQRGEVGIELVPTESASTLVCSCRTLAMIWFRYFSALPMPLALLNEYQHLNNHTQLI